MPGKSSIYLTLTILSITVVGMVAKRHDPHKTTTHLEAKVGSHITFNCYIDFPYDFEIPYIVYWSKDNKKIFTWYQGEPIVNKLYNGRFHLANNTTGYGRASANLTAIRESDQGWYHCQIIFPNRTPRIRNNGTWYHLTVQGGSLIKIPPTNQTLMEGQTAFFHCVMKYPDTSAVSWLKDGILLQDVPELLQRAFMGPQGSLSIDPTIMSDSGEYECRVQNNDSEVQTAKAFLNVQYKAKVIYAPPEVYLPFGQPAVLDCHFRANPPLKNLRWEKDGLLFDSYNVPGVYYKNNGSLYFTKVEESNAGSYTCTPFNDLGTDGPSPIINVMILRPPIFTITPRPIYIKKLGETIELPCQAIDRDGSNYPAIDWKRGCTYCTDTLTLPDLSIPTKVLNYESINPLSPKFAKDGMDLPEERILLSGGNLTVRDLQPSDRGIFECTAKNEAATITTETELLIENLAPRPPYNLTANSSDTSITLRWQPGYLRPNLEYTVWYRLTDTPEWRTMRILKPNTMEATIHQLLSGREYEFMVLSQDKYGDGMFSKQFRYYTQPADRSGEEETNVLIGERDELQQHSPVRLSAPWNLTAVLNQHGWLLQWSPPTQGLDRLQHYAMSWWREPEHHLVGNAETFDNFYQLHHLKEEATFQFQIVALSVDGNQIPSDILVLHVPSQRKTRLLVIASSIGVICLLGALAIVLYMKRSCLMHLFAGNVDTIKNDIDDDIDNADSEHSQAIDKMTNT